MTSSSHTSSHRTDLIEMSVLSRVKRRGLYVRNGGGSDGCD